MNFRFVTFLFALVGVLGVSARADIAAVPDDPPITDAAKQAEDQSQYTDEISQKVTAEVQKLVDKSSDPATVKMVREWLIQQDPQGQGVSAAYRTAYTNALNQAFITVLAQPNAPLVARLNMGVVIAGLVGAKDNLSPTVIALLKDKCPAVIIWGEKAAEAMLPLALNIANNAFNNGGQRDEVLDAIEKAVLAHPTGPMAWDIAQSGYEAINPRMWSSKNLTPAAPNQAALVKANMDLQGERIKYYLNTGVPENPQADTLASYYLMWNQIWGSLNNNDRTTVLQDSINLTGLMALRVGGLGNIQNAELIEALKKEGTWIEHLGKDLPDQGIEAAGTQLVSTARIDAKGAEIVAASQGIYAAMSATFQGLNPPENLPGSNSASETTGGNDATAPSAGAQ